MSQNIGKKQIPATIGGENHLIPTTVYKKELK